MKCNENYSWLRAGHFYYNMALLKKKKNTTSEPRNSFYPECGCLSASGVSGSAEQLGAKPPWV